MNDQRREGESFQNYRERERSEEITTRDALRGRVAWDSQSRGTFNANRNALKRAKRAAWKTARATQVRDVWDHYGWRDGGAPKRKKADDLPPSLNN